MSRNKLLPALFSLLILVSAGVVYTYYSSGQRTKIGYVNVKKIFQSVPRFKKIENHFNQLNQRTRKTYAPQIRYHRQVLRSMHSRKREDLHPWKNTVIKIQVIQARRKRKEALIGRKRQRVVTQGQKELRKVVQEIADSRNIDQVYERPDLFYRHTDDESLPADFKRLDITRDVIRRLKRKDSELKSLGG